jgi:hypothetical protein
MAWTTGKSWLALLSEATGGLEFQNAINTASEKNI